ncbi:MAG: peptidase MA family metallohydrolase [Proteobacteria bacterium]|nr:peptidase MA family metallohydrolase [Pseudomonadota bacterium]
MRRGLVLLVALLVSIASLFGTAVAGPFGPPSVMHATSDDVPRQPREALPANLVGATAHAGSVTVIGEPGLEDTAQDLASKAQLALDEISADLIDGLPRPGAIEVHLVRDSSDLPRVAPQGRGAPPWAIGVAYPDLGIISVAMRRGGTYVDPVNTLRHELAHLALGAAIGDKAPHWLHEGFAYQHSAEFSFERSETLAGMAWLGGIVSLDELDRSFPAEESPAHRAYAQSYDFVGYLSRRGHWEDTDDDGDRWPFRRFLADLGKGKTIDQAAMKAFGKPMKLLFEEWRANLSSRYLLAPIGLMGLAAWVLVALILMLAWRRRRKQNRARIALWDVEERRRDREEQRAQAEVAARLAAITLASSPAGGALVVPPPATRLDGIDPLADDPATDPHGSTAARLLN